MNITPFIELIGSLGLGIALIILGLLSQRLGKATHAKRQYLGFFVAAALLLISAGARVINLIFNLTPLDAVPQSLGWVFVYAGLPALGVTLGVIFAWRYWSWLLAERD